MQFIPYLAFNGQCEEAFKFYGDRRGGKIDAMITHEALAAEQQPPPEWRKKIMHARMSVGDALLMGGDAPAGHFKQPQGFSVNITLKNPAEGERIFRALSANGNVQMPFQETFWAAGFSMCIDRYGIPWMVNCEKAAATAGVA